MRWSARRVHALPSQQSESGSEGQQCSSQSNVPRLAGRRGRLRAVAQYCPGVAALQKSLLIGARTLSRQKTALSCFLANPFFVNAEFGVKMGFEAF